MEEVKTTKDPASKIPPGSNYLKQLCINADDCVA